MEKLCDILAVCAGCSFPPQHDSAYAGAIQYVFYCLPSMAVIFGFTALHHV